MSVAIAVEGESDVAAVQKLLGSRGIEVNPLRIFRTRGKDKLDKKVASYNQAAIQSPWLVLRDSDNDEGGCPASLRETRLPAASQSAGLCFRIAVRSIESWLLADTVAFAETFSISAATVPVRVEELIDPKKTLVDLCRRSRKRLVRTAMIPPKGSVGRVGPEYVTFITEYSRNAWRPEVAASNAPSLARALKEIDRLISTGIWH